MDKQTSDSIGMLETSDDFEAAYETYAQNIYHFLLWRTHDSDLSEDLTSTVFEKAWRKRSSFHGSSPQQWFYRIARNTLIDHWRKKRTEPLDEATLVDDTEAVSMDELLDRDIALEHIQTALMNLPEMMQHVIVLRFIDGLSCKEVGKRLTLKEGTVRVLQYRALKKLKETLL